MSIFGTVMAAAILMIAAIIIYDILVNNRQPQDALKVFVETDWTTRFSEFGVVSDTLLEKVGFAIKG